MKTTNNYYAVLTGDVINSSNLASKERKKLPSVLLQTSVYIRNVLSHYNPSKIDIFRGDSWQLIVKESEISLKVAIMLRAYFKIQMQNPTLDTRVSIGIGTVDFLTKNNISTSDGDAFRLSGRMLETMHKEYCIGVSLSKQLDDYTSKSLDVICKLIDYHIRNWSIQQARAVLGALNSFTQKEIAKNIFKSSITQQAVADHLRNSGWSYIKLALQFYEKSVKDLLYNKTQAE